MKALVTILVLSFCSSSFAWVSRDAVTKEYTFKYKLSGQALEIKKSAGSYEEAYQMASQQCFSFYKGPNKVSEDRGLDIIDVCANPRS